MGDCFLLGALITAITTKAILTESFVVVLSNVDSTKWLGNFQLWPKCYRGRIDEFSVDIIILESIKSLEVSRREVVDKKGESSVVVGILFLTGVW